MDYSNLWNQILQLHQASTTATIIQQLQIVSNNNNLHFINNLSENTNSSISSSTDKVGEENEEENSEEGEQVKEHDEDEDVSKVGSNEKKSIQRIRYSKEEYRCQQCPYNCTTEKAFFKHLRWCCASSNKSTNANQLMLSCPICGKDRKNEETLSVHMMKHKQDKHFCCDICKFKSLQLKKLIQHRRMHTGEKPHLCPFCIYRSSRRDNLRSHVRRVHKKNDLPCDTFTPRSMLIVPRKQKNALEK